MRLDEQGVRVSLDAYDALLADLYASVAEPDRLPVFLDRLNAVSGSHATAVVQHDAEHPERNGIRVPGLDPDVVARYEADFGAPDDKLWFQRSMDRMRPGVALNGEDYATKAEIKRTRYFAEILRAFDTVHSVGMCGMLTPARSLFLTPCRSERAGPHDADTMRLLRQVGRHWANACSLMLRFEQMEAQAERRAPQRGLFLLDHELRWIAGNAAAEAMVAAGWWRGTRGARLDSDVPTTRAAWQEAQRRLAQGPEAPCVIPMHDRDGTLVAFASLQPYGAYAAGEGLPAHVLFVRPMHVEDDGTLGEQLRRLFGLTGAEAALAIALRRHGDLVAAAQALDLAASGARTRLQVVFDKTGMHRQADLLRMLDALADLVA